MSWNFLRDIAQPPHLEIPEPDPPLVETMSVVPEVELGREKPEHGEPTTGYPGHVQHGPGNELEVLGRMDVHLSPPME